MVAESERHIMKETILGILWACCIFALSFGLACETRNSRQRCAEPEKESAQMITQLERRLMRDGLHCICVPTPKGEFCTALISNGSWKQMRQLMGPDGMPLECVVPRER